MKIYKLPGKLVRESDDAVIVNGPFYVIGSPSSDRTVGGNENGETYPTLCKRCKVENGAYPLKCLRLGTNGDYTFPSDYPSESPNSAFWINSGGGYLNCKILSPVNGETRYYKLYPDANDNTFYIRIGIKKVAPSGQFSERYEINFNYYRNGTNMFGTNIYSYRTADILYNYVSSSQFQLRTNAIYIPWYNASNGYLTNPAVDAYIDYKKNYNAPEVCTSSFYPHNSITYLTETDWGNWVGTFVPDEVDEDNPYYDGGTSGEGRGDANFAEDSDDVDVDPLPTIDAIGTGFATIFKPNKQQLKDLSDVMWNSNFFTFMQNLVENISQMFTSLAIVPFEVTAGTTVSVTWLGFDTAISLTLAANQFYEFDMGSINLADDNRIFTSGSALDYSPFSKLGIFLPFIGFQELDIDECRGSRVGLKYRIDILSGTCVALISINGNTIYQFTGNCLTQIPITNENMQSLVSDAVNIGIAATATHSAMGAASADMAAAEGSSKISEAAKDAKIAHAQAHVANSAGQLSSATANAAMGMKPTYGKAGSISASASLLAVKQPYLFLTTPRQSIPERYQKYCGFPSNITGKLSSFSGFTVVEDIRLNGLVATSPEIAEIYELLKKGVII